MFAFLLAQILTLLIIAALGHELRIEDEPLFDAAARLAEYTDERLRAATLGEPLPDAPEFAGDLVAARVAYVMGIVNAVALVAIALFAMSRWRGPVLHALRMHRYAFDRIWKPALVTIAGYVLVIAYTVIVNALDLNFIEPENTVPGSISRDAWGLAIFGVVAVVAASLSEELLFRGLVFGGLVRWGFWPAAVISGVGFSMAHLDPGTFIPFTLIGMALAWAYWSSGNLWDSIIAHCLFNTTSFLVLLSRF